jgi:hypothetical protein
MTTDQKVGGGSIPDAPAGETPRILDARPPLVER